MSDVDNNSFLEDEEENKRGRLYSGAAWSSQIKTLFLSRILFSSFSR